MLQRWHISTDRGDEVTCRFLLFCNGTLTDPKFSPSIKGYESFEGESFHTSRVPHDLAERAAGKRVAIIGTGASCVQLLPELAKVAGHVSICQVTRRAIPTTT